MRAVVWLSAAVLTLGFAAAGAVEVEITFSSSGTDIAGKTRYAAVLQGRALVAEVELPPGEVSWKLRLEPGEYTVACGAEGYGNKSLRMVVQEGKQQAVRCGLLPLVAVKGRLVSKINGKPIAGGTVGPAFLALHELPFESKLLERHLRLKHEGVSDEEGRFSFGLLPGDNVVLVATAAEHGFRVMGPLVVGSQGLDLGDVALEGGGRVRVRVEPWGQDFAQGKWWVDLVPSGQLQESSSRLLDPQSVIMALLSKPLGENGEVSFEAVPAGTYVALLSTLPERLLRRSGGSIPEGMTYRPSHSTSPFVVAAGSFQEVLLRPTRWEVTVSVSGLEKGRCADFEPWAFSPVVNYTVSGHWENQNACEFSVLLEASGPWILGLRRRGGAGESAVPLGTVDIPEGSGKKEVQLTVAIRSVEGKVVDAAGNPVPFAEVRLSNSLSCSNRGFSWRGKTDRNGSFLCPAAPAEPLVVWAYRSDLGWAMEEKVMDEPLVLRLVAGKQVSLRVLNEEGNPVSAQLQFSPQGAEGLTVGVLDEKGEAVIRHMPTVDGSLLVALLSPDAEAKSLGHFKLFVPAEKRGFLGVYQALPGAKVSWWPGNLPKGGAFCALETEDGAILGTDAFEVLTFGSDASRPGLVSKRWERLAPGRFRPVVTDEACKPIWRGKWFVVGAGETVELREKAQLQ
ncbi:hypothetical protein EG19_02775 [Thermoanaerobaculum aquaticum]|uniref:Carboxypeptidase regulatory-like domain-containing protein n=1 Tax=Thermoanaerobaculum aquaticum TaxID=1312852 RepID=A0A062XMG8_9BACT|nr:carboxypeptidase-like regulatory domain-containing protein [Thermoanaerobaculum aquaticum]KDA53757.1 hypothetical protein EG19_02775 [Thermoanaerobaculum aquaticum]